MNLGEFLYKIMPANIYDKDIENLMINDSQSNGRNNLNTMPGPKNDRKTIFNLDKFKVNLKDDEEHEE